jgi:hypothetical protein
MAWSPLPMSLPSSLDGGLYTYGPLFILIFPKFNFYCYPPITAEGYLLSY